MIAIVDYGAGNIRSVVNALGRVLGSLAPARTGGIIPPANVSPAGSVIPPAVISPVNESPDGSVISTEALGPSGEIPCKAWPQEIVLTADKAVLRAADKVILPGVGEASTAMKALTDCGLADFIPTLTQPVLGICVGAQLMCRRSEEGDTPCMGIFATDVRRFIETATEKVPHMGWNSLFSPDTKEISPLGPRASVEMTASPVSPCATPTSGDSLSSEAPSDPVSSRASVPPVSSRASVPLVSSRAKSRDLSSPLFAGLPEGSYVYFVHSYYPDLCPDTIAVSHHGMDFSAALAKDNFFACQFHPEKSGSVGERILKNFLAL